MPSLKEFRNRIASVKSTQKITKAMQMVAAAKLKRAQGQAEAARPYAERMARVMANLAAAVSGDSAPALLRSQHGALLDAIRTSKDLSDDSAGKLKGVVDGYAKSFA